MGILLLIRLLNSLSLPLHIFTPVQAAILLGIAALLGAIMGSFINCLAWRAANGESVLKGRSHCPACDHGLGPLDLIPIVSWLALRGRCRHCGQRVSARYVLVEAALALVFAALLVVHGAGVPWLAYAALATILMGAALVDLDTFTIPNGFVIAAIAIWLASVWFMRAPAPDMFGVGSMFVPLVGAGWLAVVLDGAVGAFAVGGGILLFSLAFDAATKRTSLGGGDVKLLNLLVACVMGLAFAVASGLSAPPSASDGSDELRDAGGGRAENLKAKAIPFGPAIAAATALTLLAGPSVLTWYTGLFL